MGMEIDTSSERESEFLGKIELSSAVIQKEEENEPEHIDLGSNNREFQWNTSVRKPTEESSHISTEVAQSLH